LTPTKLLLSIVGVAVITLVIGVELGSVVFPTTKTETTTWSSTSTESAQTLIQTTIINSTTFASETAVLPTLPYYAGSLAAQIESDPRFVAVENGSTYIPVSANNFTVRVGLYSYNETIIDFYLYGNETITYCGNPYPQREITSIIWVTVPIAANGSYDSASAINPPQPYFYPWSCIVTIDKASQSGIITIKANDTH